MMNVVVFGPKFWNKFARQKRKTKKLVPLGNLIRLLNAKPGIKFVVKLLPRTFEAMQRTHDAKEHGENYEAHELNWPSAPAVDEEEAYPISRNQPRDREDDVPNTDVFQVLIHVGRATEADSLENHRRVQAEGIERHLWAGSAMRCRCRKGGLTSMANHEYAVPRRIFRFCHCPK